jgi:hypothetical protein
MTVVAVFGLLFLERFDLVLEGGDLVSQLFDCLERLFAGVLQRAVLLFEQLHLLLFDGSCLSQKEVLVSQAFQFNIPVHEGILPERLWVGPGTSPSGCKSQQYSGENHIMILVNKSFMRDCQQDHSWKR